MKTLAVTGATGFVGSHLMAVALKAGWLVRALVRDPARLPKHRNLEAVVWNAEGDVPPEALRGADAVVHAAAVVPPDLSDPAYAEACMEVNAMGTLRLLQAAQQASVRRFVYFSSANCYAPTAALVSEAAPLFPSARAPYYLASKLAGEIYVAHWQIAGRLSTCSLRLASVYGAGMPPREVVALFARRMRSREKIRLHGGGHQRSDFVHVADVVMAALAAAAGSVEGPLNIGSGQQVAIRELAATMAELLGGQAHALILAEDRPVQPSGYAGLDITRAVRELGFRPLPIREGLSRYLSDTGASA